MAVFKGLAGDGIKDGVVGGGWQFGGLCLVVDTMEDEGEADEEFLVCRGGGW